MSFLALLWAIIYFPNFSFSRYLSLYQIFENIFTVSTSMFTHWLMKPPVFFLTLFRTVFVVVTASAQLHISNIFTRAIVADVLILANRFTKSPVESWLFIQLVNYDRNNVWRKIKRRHLCKVIIHYIIIKSRKNQLHYYHHRDINVKRNTHKNTQKYLL